MKSKLAIALLPTLILIEPGFATSGQRTDLPRAADVVRRLGRVVCMSANQPCPHGYRGLGAIIPSTTKDKDRVTGASWKIDLDWVGRSKWAKRNFIPVREVFTALGLRAVASDPWLASAIRKTRTDYCPQEKYYGTAYVVVSRSDFADRVGRYSHIDVYLGGDRELLATIKGRAAMAASSCRG